MASGARRRRISSQKLRAICIFRPVPSRPLMKQFSADRAVAGALTVLLHVVILLAINWKQKYPEPPRTATASLQVVEISRAPAPKAENPPPEPQLSPVSHPIVLPPAPMEAPATTSAISLPVETTNTAAPVDASKSAQTAAPAAAAPPADYVAQLARRIGRTQRYPLAARVRHQEGTALLLFELDRSGRLLSWRIIRSSNNEALDSEVGRMVSAAAPFPPFPKGLDKPSESFVVPVEFSLKALPSN
jgi:periplasmic protein TonB